MVSSSGFPATSNPLSDMTLLLCAVVKDNLSASFLFSDLSQWSERIARLPDDRGIGIEFVAGTDEQESIWDSGPGAMDLHGYFALLAQGEHAQLVWLALHEAMLTCDSRYESPDDFEIREGTIEEEARRRLDDGEIDPCTLIQYFDVDAYCTNEVEDEYTEIDVDGESYIINTSI